MPFTLRHISLLLLVVGLSLVAWVGPRGAAADDPAPVPIAAAPPLTWGFKQSWRQYNGPAQVADGASLVAGASAADPYGIAWEFDAGSFDATEGKTVLRYSGSAHWLKYYAPDKPEFGAPPAGYTGPLDVYRLDVKLSDPIVTIGPDAATISVEAVSRDLRSWELVDFGRVDLVTLDVTGTTPVVAGGVTTWTAIPAFAEDSSEAVFSGQYDNGLALDPLSVSYTGPGGAPDFTEEWDNPGSTKLSLVDNEILTTDGLASGYSPWWIDRERRVVHYRQWSVVGAETFWHYRAFNLDTMSQVAELTLPDAQRVTTTSLFDTTGGRIFYGSPSSVGRWIKFDAQAGYQLGTPTGPFPISGTSSGLFWDPVGKRAFNVQRVVPVGVSGSAYDLHQWTLHSYAEQPDGSWVRQSYPLSNLPQGLNQRGYAESGVADAAPGIAAADGSLILLGTRQTSNDPSVAAPATVPGAWRIQIDGGQATATPVPGTQVENSTSGVFDALRAGPDGEVVLFREGSLASGIPHVVQTLTVAGDGAIEVGPRTDLGNIDVAGASAFTVDPEDGTAWVGGSSSRRLLGVKGGAIVFDQFVAERHPNGGPLVAGANHTVYAQTNDGSPPPVGGSPIFGFGRFERLGWSPGVAVDPQPESVALSEDEDSEPAQFQSTATGDPAPERQWQVKAPGALRFTDLEGETGTTLAVDAERGMGGNQYRAVYSNAAGRVASEPAMLAVDYTPRIAVDLADVETVEGEDALFEVLSQGAPEPDVTWQRRVGGFWQTVASDDDNFTIGEGTLTVHDTNVDQSGALFRARIGNSVGVVYSRAARLEVEGRFAIPPGGLSLDGVSLDWAGSAELQRMAPNGQPNYFSAGVSDGGEGTYAAATSGARVLHKTALGQETSAAWSTRAAQAAGAVKQIVRLIDGHAEIEQDGSARVTWSGAFSVNFYGGLVPFTVSSPELTVDADGDGTLRADLSGYGASMADPSDRHPVAPVADVTVATFSGVEVDPEGVITIEPDYAGVEVDAPAGFSAQDRAASGWGAWPQPFVDFQGVTGLAPYWYSSGGAFDPHKEAEPFSVDFTGAGSVPPLVPGGDPPPPAADRASVTTLSVGRSSYGRSAVATVRVSTVGGPASGVANVRVAGRSRTATLRDGRARLRLPARIRPGAHTVRASYAGWAGVAASSASATLRVAKAKPRVRFAIRRSDDGATLRVSARIPDARSLHPTGQIIVRDGGRIIEVGRLRRADRGKVPVALPRLRRGAHFLRVSLSGGRLQQGVTTGYRVLRVE